MDAALKSWLQHDVTLLERQSSGSDLYGNDSYSFVALGTYKGKFEYLSGDEDTDGRDVAFGTQRVIFNGDVPCRSEQRVQIGSRLFNINHVNVRYDLKGNEHHRVAYLEEIDGGA